MTSYRIVSEQEFRDKAARRYGEGSFLAFYDEVASGMVKFWYEGKQ